MSAAVSPKPLPLPVVGIGASAGGLDAFTKLLGALTPVTGMAYVVVQHLDPTHKSTLAELLNQVCKMPVKEATNNTPVDADHVYVIPPNMDIEFRAKHLYLTERPPPSHPHKPIDQLFGSLADDRTCQPIGVILSGTGEDGTIGLHAIKAEGGITFAQDASAKFEAMPRSAQAADCVDFVLPPEEIANELVRIGKHPFIKVEPHGVVFSGNRKQLLATIFSMLRQVSRIDFSHYKQTTIQRRIQRRMIVHKLDHLSDYVRLLQDTPHEAEVLCQELLIHVTHFFRDPSTFAALTKLVFPQLVQDQPADAPIRIWVVGCSTGEEVYSLAICFLEYFELHNMRREIKIFGTDLSDKAIATARAAKYSHAITADVSAERLRRYFVEDAGSYFVSKSIREMCVFARQDVTRDPPFSNLDLVSCRNVLIYLGTPLQQRVFPVFHYALRESGMLLLGRAESLSASSDLFTIVDKQHKIYARKSKPSRVVFDFAASEDPLAPIASRKSPQALVPSVLDIHKEADRIVLAQYAPTGVVINDEWEVLQFRGQTGQYLTPPPGVPNHNLLKMARDGLLLELRTAVTQAKTEGKPVRRRHIRVKTNDHYTTVDVTVTPMRVPPAPQTYYVILFDQDAPPRTADLGELTSPHAASSDEAQTVTQLEQELQGMKEYLQSVMEQSEASDEELRAANEEVLSSNEELQSINEELQTAKEEMQATNEELSTVNEELEHRHAETTQLNDDLNNLLHSIAIPIVMLADNLCIRRFTSNAGKLFNLKPADVGRPITEIRSNIVNVNLPQMILDVMDDLAVAEHEVQDDKGVWHRLSIRPYRTMDNKIDGAVITVTNVDAQVRTRHRIQASLTYAECIINTVHHPLLVLETDFRIVTANAAFYQTFALDGEHTVGQTLFDLAERQWDIAALRTALYDVVHNRRALKQFTMDAEFAEIGRRYLVINAHWIKGDHDEFAPLLLAIEDITTQKQHDEEKRVLEHRLQEKQKLESLGILAAGLAHDFNNLLTVIIGNASLAEAAPRASKEVKDKVRQIIDCSQKAADICSQMLTYSGKGQISLGVTNINTIVNETLPLLNGFIAKNATLTLELQSDLPAILGDARQIRQLLINLVINASEALTERSSTISISTGLIWANRAVLATNLAGLDLDEGNYITLQVRDTGSGMTPETVAKMFDPFFTTKSTGRGLGLAAVIGIVRAHRGAFCVETEEGAGSTFRLFFPQTEIPVANDASELPTPQSVRVDGTVLVVDDDDDVRKVVAKMLSGFGLTVLEADSGQKAVDEFRAQVDAITLVLLDLNMPRMNGEETYRELIQVRSDVRVIIISGDPADEISKRFENDTIAGVLHKPFRPAQLFQMLQSILK